MIIFMNKIWLYLYRNKIPGITGVTTGRVPGQWAMLRGMRVLLSTDVSYRKYPEDGIFGHMTGF
jgi:hypothetical protein